MARFDRQIATALRLIAKNGVAVKWKKFIKTEVPGKPWESTQTPVEYDAVICFLPLTKSLYESLAFIPGTDVQTGGTMGLMGQVSFEVEDTDVVIDYEGKELAIETVQTIAPNGQKILHTMVFKK